MTVLCHFCPSEADHTITLKSPRTSVMWLRTCTYHLERGVDEGVATGLGLVGIDECPVPIEAGPPEPGK